MGKELNPVSGKTYKEAWVGLDVRRKAEAVSRFHHQIEMAYDLNFTEPLPRFTYAYQSWREDWNDYVKREKGALPEDYLGNTDPNVLSEGLHTLDEIAKKIASVLTDGGVMYATGEAMPPDTHSRIGIKRKVLIAEDHDGFLMQNLLQAYGYKDPSKAPILGVWEAESLEAVGLIVDNARFAHGYVFPPRSARFLSNNVRHSGQARSYYGDYVFDMVAGEMGNKSVIVSSDYLPAYILRQAILTELMEGSIGENSWSVRRLETGKDGNLAVIEDWDYFYAANHLTSTILGDLHDATKLPFLERSKLALASGIEEVRFNIWLGNSPLVKRR